MVSDYLTLAGTSSALHSPTNTCIVQSESLEVDAPMSNFDPNAILRGAQLTLVGVNRALQNPGIFTTSHYRQAAIAVVAGLAIRIIINIPIYLVKALIFFLSFIVDLDHETWDDKLINGLDFIQKSVLQVPYV